MKLLVDFFPVLLFFLAFKFFDIYVATAVTIAASMGQVLVFRLLRGRFEPMHLMTLGVIAVFGGLTLYLQNEAFIKWKPTVVNWLFGLLFLASQVAGKTPMIQRLLGGSLSLPHPVWRRLNLGWTIFFLLLGFVNLLVFSLFDTETWVNFKLFGILGLTLVFVLLQSFYLARHLPQR